jgi:hypothetical protein
MTKIWIKNEPEKKELSLSDQCFLIESVCFLLDEYEKSSPRKYYKDNTVFFLDKLFKKIEDNKKYNPRLAMSIKTSQSEKL